MATADEKVAEQLKDRRDYRETLIRRRNELEVKIHKVEMQIRLLTAGKRGKP